MSQLRTVAVVAMALVLIWASAMETAGGDVLWDDWVDGVTHLDD